MKKNLFDVDVSNELVKRAQQLTINSKPLWGSMTPVEMLRHCSEALQATLRSNPSTTPSTFKQKIGKFLILHVIQKIPKGKQSPKFINMTLQPFMLERFEKELENFERVLIAFQSHSTLIVNKHPYFGTMNNKEWGIVSWMHMDHHLRQFGV